MSHRKGMSGHQSARPVSHVWLTPPPVLDAIGGWESFDLDPCASIDRPYPTARNHMTVADDGLRRDWFGRVFLNPPYEVELIRRFLAKMAQHGRGMGLIFARTETQHFQRLILPVCDALFFIEGRLHFHYPDGRRAKHNAGAPSVLCAYGPEDAEILSEIALDGAFMPLRLRLHHLPAPQEVEPRSWAEELYSVMHLAGSITVGDLYAAFNASAKIANNPNWKAKLRQHLQRGPYRNVARGQWELAR